MIRLASRIDVSEETMELAHSVEQGEHTRETLEQLMDSQRIAQYTVDMTASTLSLRGIVSMLVGRDDMRLTVQLIFLCGVKRVWEQRVLNDTTSKIPYGIMEIAGFAGFLFSSDALLRILPLPEGGVRHLLMRIDGADARYEQGGWFQYILTHQESRPERVIEDVLQVLFDHPHDNVVEYLVTVCVQTHMPLVVEHGDAVLKLLHACVAPAHSQRRRRRRRSGVVVATRREAALARLLEAVVTESAHAATILHDVLVHQLLPRRDLDGMCMDTLASLVCAVQRRLPYAPLTEDMLVNVSEEVRRDVPAWSSVLDAVRRAPPLAECVDHPQWRVRRHF